ncbi:NTP transferase domain-containing protein [Bacteriovoracales bacterium]|nr:NTP transferase domain-containing protein [Bacteriovoracales bacterium]
MKKSYPLPLISFCRKDSWENSGLPNAILQDLKGKSEIKIESYDSKNISTSKDHLYKDFLYKIMNPQTQAILFKNNYLPKVPKIVFLEDDSHLKELKKEDYWDDILGFICAEKNRDQIEGRACFFFGEITKISDFLLKNIFQKVEKDPLHGLVLLGGKGKRMKRDKGALDYFGKPQSEHVYKLLSTLCDDVYVSCRNEQQESEHLKNLKGKLLPDQFLEYGPMGGILTALRKEPEASWLVLACDLPYVSEDLLKSLIKRRNPLKMATCLENPEKGWPEPLCTIYEPIAYKNFLQYLSVGIECPRKVLMNSNIETLKIKDKLALQNVNTPEEFRRAKTELQANI